MTRTARMRRASYSCLVLSSGRKLENSEHQPLDVRAFADLDENCCVTCLCARVVHRLARRSVCNDRNKHKPVAAGRQPQDLEAANFHLGSKKSAGSGPAYWAVTIPDGG